MQTVVFGRIHIVDTAGQDRHGPGLERPFVGGGVDAAGHTRNYDISGLSQGTGKGSREAATGGRGDSCPDHGYGGALQQRRIAEEPQEGWRRINGREEAGKARFATGDHPDVHGDRGVHLPAHIVPAGNIQGRRPSAAPSEIRERLERAGGRAEADDQMRKCDRAHRFGPG